MYTEATLIAQYVFQIPTRLHCDIFTPRVEVRGWCHAPQPLLVIVIDCFYLLSEYEVTGPKAHCNPLNSLFLAFQLALLALAVETHAALNAVHCCVRPCLNRLPGSEAAVRVAAYGRA